MVDPAPLRDGSLLETGEIAMTHRLLLIALLVLPALRPAHAADQLVLGSQLVVKDPGTPERRKVTVKAKEKASDDTIVGDPVTNGASVTVTATGAASSEQTFAMPVGLSASSQKPFWTGDPVKGFKYRDSKGENGPVKTAQIKLKGGVFQIKVVIDGKLGAVSVVPPHPGSEGCALFAIGSGDSYSVAFPATSQVTNDGAVLFKIVKPTAEGSCVPTTTSTTSSSTTSSTSSSTTSTTLGFPYVTPPGAAPLRYRDDVFTGVTVTSDQTYGTAVNLSGQTVTLTFDFYEPTGDAITLRPLIIWVHGGSFCCGSKTSAELVDEANVFSKKGYVNASINYRLESPGCSAGAPTVQCVQAINEAYQDAQTAVRFFRTNAATYGIDVNRIAMGGSSAGAITALNVGAGVTENPTAAIAGAVSLSGAKLLNQIDANDCPMMLFHGTSDTVVPYQWAVNTYNEATNAGIDVWLTSWAGAGHVPYVQHRTEILDQTRNFLWWEMDLLNAAQ
jgi:acetyl esterase/lipase